MLIAGNGMGENVVTRYTLTIENMVDRIIEIKVRIKVCSLYNVFVKGKKK